VGLYSTSGRLIMKDEVEYIVNPDWNYEDETICVNEDVQNMIKK
jgi:hypothetical protein